MSSAVPANRPLRVAFVDAHAFTRQCICDLMQADGLQVLGLVDVEDAAAKAGSQPVDAVVLRLDTISLRDYRVVADLHALHQLWPRASLLALAPFEDADAAFEVLRLGLSGCFSPAMTISDMSAALRLVVAGGIFVGPSQLGDGQRFAPAAPHMHDLGPSLTPREAEVLAMLRQGKPNKLIAFNLEMAENTVKVHVARILKKFGAANRTAIANLDAEAVRRRGRLQ